MNQDKNNAKSVLMLVTSMLIIGSVGVFRRYIPVSSAMLAFARGIIGGLFLLVFLLLRQRRERICLPIKTVFLIAAVGAVLGVNWILLFEAFNHTSIAVATLCYYMEPTIVLVAASMLFKERMTARKAICAAVAVIGMILVSGILDGSSDGDLRGPLFGIGAAVLYSTVVLMNKRLCSIDVYQKTTIQLLSAGSVMFPYLLQTNGFVCNGFSPATFLLILIVGIVHTGIVYLLYFGSMDGLKAQSVAILSYIDPVSALLFSTLFLKEELSVQGILGAVMIIVSAIVSELRTAQP